MGGGRSQVKPSGPQRGPVDPGPRRQNAAFPHAPHEPPPPLQHPKPPPPARPLPVPPSAEETNSLDPVEAVRRLVTPFFTGGPAQAVYLVRCCDFIYVGVRQAGSCSKCKKTVDNHAVFNLDAALEWAGRLTIAPLAAK